MRRMNVTFVLVISFLFFTISLNRLAGAEPQEAQTRGCEDCPMMHGGGMAGEMGGMMGHSMMSGGQHRMGRETETRQQRSSLMGLLHRWGNLLFAHQQELGITYQQMETIRSILAAHIKFAIPKLAERKVLLIDIEQQLAQDQVDLQKVEQQVKAMEALGTNMIMEGVQTYQKMVAVLSPEQQSKLKSLFRESILSSIIGMPDHWGGKAPARPKP